MSGTAFHAEKLYGTKRPFSVVKRAIFSKCQGKNADIYYNGKLVSKAMMHGSGKQKTFDHGNGFQQRVTLKEES